MHVWEINDEFIEYSERLVEGEKKSVENWLEQEDAVIIWSQYFINPDAIRSMRA